MAMARAALFWPLVARRLPVGWPGAVSVCIPPRQCGQLPSARFNFSWASAGEPRLRPRSRQHQHRAHAVRAKAMGVVRIQGHGILLLRRWAGLWERASVPAQEGEAALLSPSDCSDLGGFLGHWMFNSEPRSGLGRYIIFSHSITLVTQASVPGEKWGCIPPPPGAGVWRLVDLCQDPATSTHLGFASSKEESHRWWWLVPKAKG